MGKETETLCSKPSKKNLWSVSLLLFAKLKISARICHLRKAMQSKILLVWFKCAS